MMDMNEDAKHIRSEAGTTDCDACGGDMIYDPESKKLKCKFCGSLQDVAVAYDQVREQKLASMTSMDFSWDISAKTIVCENCGGQTITEPNDETSYCSYCGSQHIVIREDDNMGMKPQGLVPYAISNKDAKGKMQQWVGRRWLAPSDLKKRFIGKDLKGIYMPYWTFDSNVHSSYHCRIGNYYYEGHGEDRKRKVRWRHHSGQYDKFFDDVLVAAVDFKEPGLLKKIEPFRTSEGQVVNYKPDFLSGYQARKYTIMPEQALDSARRDMENQIANEIKRHLPGDTYESYRQQVSFMNEHYKHILLPVYMTAYEYNSKIYNVLINGQTGEVQGKAPLSPWKVTGLIVLGAILAGVIYYVSNS